MTGENAPDLQPWDPARMLRGVSSHESRLSRGFLRANPASWFPGLSAQWGALFAAYSADVKILEVKPTLSLPRSLPFAFGGLLDDEPLGIFLDEASARVILEMTSPDASPGAGSVVLEYAVRRLLHTLTLSWSGPELGELKFDPDSKIRDAVVHGSVKVSLRIQQQACTLWFSLGPSLVEQFDRLWRKQQASISKFTPAEGGELRLEIAQLGVPPAELPNYVRPRTVIDLEVPISDTLIVRMAGKPLFAAQLIDIDGRFGFETLPGPAPTPIVPDGMTRIGIEIGVLPLDATMIGELMQAGSIYQTPIPIGDRVTMSINGESVAQAKLCSFSGRFALALAS